MLYVKPTAVNACINKSCVQDKMVIWLMLLISCWQCHKKHQVLAHACIFLAVYVVQAADTCVKPECKSAFVFDPAFLFMIIGSGPACNVSRQRSAFL